jgi:hypothetical protein
MHGIVKTGEVNLWMAGNVIASNLTLRNRNLDSSANWRTSTIKTQHQ